MSLAAGAPPRTVSTIDLLKTVAVVLMLADHVGLYLFENAWLRVAGRPVAVIFGFLIGYSASSRIPPSWIGLGLGLSLLNRWLFPGEENHPLDILVTLALTRAGMPFIDRVHASNPLLLVPLAAVLGLLTVPVNEFMEYGTEVPILALLGAAVRRDRGTRHDKAARQATGLAALVAISLAAILHFDFTPLQATVCVAVLAATMLALTSFERREIWAPIILAPTLSWTGRNTLWIYAAHLAALQILAWAMMDASTAAAEEADEADD